MTVLSPGPLLLCKLPFLRSEGDFCIPLPTPMTPRPLSPPPIPKPPLQAKPGRPESVKEEDVAGGAAEEEEALAVELVGKVREGDDDSGGLTSVVKQGPNLLRQLPFFFFLTPSSPPPAVAPAFPGPVPEGCGRL